MISNLIDFFRSRRKSQVLCYHSVGRVNPFESKVHHINLSTFQQQIELLIKSKYSFTPIEEYLKVQPVNKKVISITFDDGYRNVLEEAIPFLDSIDIPSTLFISTSVLNKEIFWRDKVRIVLQNQWVEDFMSYLNNSDPIMHKSIDPNQFYFSTKSNVINSKSLNHRLSTYLESRNVSLKDENLYVRQEDLINSKLKTLYIGNHTVNHFRLSTLSEEEQHAEISHAQQSLSQLSYPLCNIFAIPFGENGSFNQDTINIIKDLKFDGFLMTNQNQKGFQTAKLNVNPIGLKYSNRYLPRDDEKVF